MRGDVVRRPAREPGEVGRRREQAPAGLLAVGAAEHRLGLVLQVAHEGLPGVAAAVGVVEGAEEFADRAEGGDVAAGDLLAGAALALAALAGYGGAALRGHAVGGFGAAHAVVGAADEPVPAGHHEPGRGEGDLAELGVAAGVLAPQPADDVDGLLGGRGEFEPGVHRRTGVEPEVLGGQPAPEPAGEDLGDEGGRGASGLLSAQPPGDGCLVVSEIESVLQTELVHATGETCVGEPRFCDERGELTVGSALRGSFRHLRCGLLPFGPQQRPMRPLPARIACEQPFWPRERRECSGA